MSFVVGLKRCLRWSEQLPLAKAATDRTVISAQLESPALGAAAARTNADVRKLLVLKSSVGSVWRNSDIVMAAEPRRC